MSTSQVLPESLHQPLSGPMVWDNSTQIADEGVVSLDRACQAELAQAADFIVKHPLPVTLIDSGDFSLPHCRELCQHVRRTLDDGVGFVIVERLPVETYDYDTLVKLYWLLVSMVGRPVAQKWDGEMIYDVVDTGRKATAGSGVRSSKTNAGQVYHTDNSFNLPPSFVALLCLRPAQQGGESGLISFDRVYNRLLSAYPDVLPRLEQPFYFDRQREHEPEGQLYSYAPVFEWLDGQLHVRLATNLIRQGHVVAEQPIDDRTERALRALDDVMESPDLGKTFDFKPGQIQIVNNRRIGHRRTAFKDADDPALKRHMVRIWLRDQGNRSYLG